MLQTILLMLIMMSVQMVLDGVQDFTKR